MYIIHINGVWKLSLDQTKRFMELKKLDIDQFKDSIHEIPSSISVFVKIIISNITSNDVCWDNFLFLLKQTNLECENVDDNISVNSWTSTSPVILINPFYCGKVYHRDVLICKKPSLPFGINILTKLNALSWDKNELFLSAAQIIEHYLFSFMHTFEDSKKAIDYIYALLNKQIITEDLEYIVKIIKKNSSWSNLFYTKFNQLHNSSETIKFPCVKF